MSTTSRDLNRQASQRQSYSGPQSRLEALDAVFSDTSMPILEAIRFGQYDDQLDAADLPEEISNQRRLTESKLVDAEASAEVSDTYRHGEWSPRVTWTLTLTGSPAVIRAVVDSWPKPDRIYDVTVASAANGRVAVAFQTVYDPNRMDDRSAAYQRSYVIDITKLFVAMLEQAAEATTGFNEWLPGAIRQAMAARLEIIRRRMWFQDQLNKPAES